MRNEITRNPFLPDDRDTVKALRSVYVVYAAMGGIWVLAGFVRRKLIVRRHRSMNQRFAGIRQKLGISRGVVVAVVDLATAQHNVRETGRGISSAVPLGA